MELRRDSVLNYITKSAALLFMVSMGLAGCDSESSTGPDSGGNETQNVAQVAAEDSSLRVFSETLVEAGLDSELESDESYTLFAPTDSAFERLPEGFLAELSADEKNQILSYHLLPGAMYEGDIQGSDTIEPVAGGSIFVNAKEQTELNRSATIVEGDKEAANGVIHKIDQVLIPDSYLTVFEVIDKRYSLAKFACHCTSGRTELDDVLNNEGSEFTVFAPTDEAFDNFGNVDNLSDPELERIMNYHVIEQKLLSDQLTDGESLETLNGETIQISVADDGTISLNGGQAVVQKADLQGTNGALYIIDTVMDPDAGTASQ
ncbi:MAG TPA: fasciclin domain-containing protein [Fodinibius sp.]|nr:fasciclin domain-containing protein [Fodinibius sp.]